MKILLITHILPYPPRIGCAQRNYNLIKACSEKHELHLVTFYRQAHWHDGDRLEDAVREMRRYCQEVHVFPLPGEQRRLWYYTALIRNLFSAEPYSAALYRSPAFERTIRQLLDVHQYDAIEIGEVGLLNYARLAPGIPKLLVHHNVESHLLHRRAQAATSLVARWYVGLQARRTEHFERIASNLIESHTVCSELDRATLIEINPNANAAVIPNGVDTDFFQSTGEAVEPNSLVFVGGLDWLPNRDAMMFFREDIWPRLKAAEPGIRMTVIGGSPPADLTAFATAEPHFEVRGFVDDIRSEVSRAALYVVPIRIGGGTRLKILDALSMGKAIVSHPVGAEGIPVVDGEEIVLADSAIELADRILELLRDVERRKQLEKRARQVAMERFDWKRIAPRLLDVYSELASSRTRAAV